MAAAWKPDLGAAHQYEVYVNTAMCWRKACYPNVQMARRLARRHSQLSGAFIHEYKCPLGEHWHIGHP